MLRCCWYKQQSEFSNLGVVFTMLIIRLQFFVLQRSQEEDCFADMCNICRHVGVHTDTHTTHLLERMFTPGDCIPTDFPN